MNSERYGINMMATIEENIEKKKFPTDRITRGCILPRIPYEECEIKTAVPVGVPRFSGALHPNEDGDHHRGFVGAGEEEPGHDIGQVILRIIEVDRIHVVRGVLNSFLNE